MPEADLKKLKLGQVPVDDEAFGLDVKINEGYNAYSAELVRLALLVITGLSIVWLKVYFPNPVSAKLAGLPGMFFIFFILAFVSAALSAGAALVHRYTSIDALACHLEALRRRIRNRPERTGAPPSEKRKRQRSVAEQLSRLRQWFAAAPETASSNSDKSDVALAIEQEMQRNARLTWSARLLRLSATLLFLSLLFFCFCLASFMRSTTTDAFGRQGRGLTNERSITSK